MLNTSPNKNQSAQPFLTNPYYMLNSNQHTYYLPQNTNFLSQTQNNQQKTSQVKNENQEAVNDKKNLDYTNPMSIIKANILNNRPMVFSNYQQFDFALIFEEQLKILNNHQQYTKKIYTLRLDLPQISQITYKLKQLKDEILQKQFTNSKKIYNNFIKPKTTEMINQTINLQRILENQNNLSAIPQNPYYKQNQVIEQVQISFEHRYHQVNEEMNNFEQKLTTLLTSIKQFQAQYSILKDENQLKQQQEIWDDEKKAIITYLETQLTQSITQLINLHQQQIQKIYSNENQDVLKSDQPVTIHTLLYKKGGIVEFYELLSMIEGELQSLEQLKQKTENLDLQLAQIKIKFIEFDDSYKQIVNLHNEIKKHRNSIQIIFKSPIKPLLQQYQIKHRQKCLNYINKIYSETNQLTLEGQLIVKFDFSKKIKQFKAFEFQRDLSNIVQLIDDYEQLYIQNFYQVPLEDLQILTSIYIKLEKQYAETNFIRLEIESLLGAIKFVGYKAYIIETIKPQFIIDFKNIHDRMAIIISYKFQNQEILSKAQEALNIVYPQFGWNESIENEKTRHWLLQDKLSQIQNIYLDFQSLDLSTSYKFMKQIEQTSKELNNIISDIEQYFIIKEIIADQRIDLLKWPNVQLQEIKPFNHRYFKLIAQTNEKVRAILILKQLNPFQQLQQILGEFSNDSLEKLKSLLIEVQKTEHSTILQHQFKIFEEYLKVCVDHFIEDLDLKFCQTNTYKELEDVLGGTTKLSELRFQNELKQEDQELRQNLYELVSNFMKQKLTKDFANLFQLKIIQSQEGTSNFDPYKLQFRTDLLHPIHRSDINQNYYCLLEKQKLENIIDQPELRMIFYEFRQLLVQSTKIINESQDLQQDQELILELLKAYESQLTLKINLTNLQPMKKFHQDFKDWKTSLKQEILPLGIVLRHEYDQYLKACRKRIALILQGTEITIEKNDDNFVLENLIFNVNGKYLKLELLIDQCYYQDYKSIVFSKIQTKVIYQSEIVIYVNDRQLLKGQEILL